MPKIVNKARHIALSSLDIPFDNMEPVGILQLRNGATVWGMFCCEANSDYGRKGIQPNVLY